MTAHTGLSWTAFLEEAVCAREEAPDGAANMAIDETLARSCGSGEGFVRFYRWRRPTLSFGRNEPSTEAYLPPDEIEELGVDVVRRPTGGRAVLHDRELTYSVIAPVDAFPSLRAAYRSINLALIEGLSRLGVPVVAAPESPALPPDAGPCFQAPAEGEVMFGGRKLVGSAQVRIGRRILQHGSILFADDQRRLQTLRRRDAEVHSDAEDGGRPATLADALNGVPQVEEVTEAVLGGFEARLFGDWRHGSTRDSLPTTTLHERLRHYRSPEWTWRR